MSSYQGFPALLVVLDPHSIHPQRNLLSLRPDLDDPIPQLQLLSLRFANALLQREQGINCNRLQFPS